MGWVFAVEVGQEGGFNGLGGEDNLPDTGFGYYGVDGSDFIVLKIKRYECC